MRLIGGLVLVGFLAIGCGKVSNGNDDGDDDGTTDDDADPDDGDPADGSPGTDGSPKLDADVIVEATCSEPPDCGYAGEVGSTADMVAVVEKCETWGEVDVDRFNPRTPTLLATQTITVCSEDFSLPSNCEGKPRCFANLRITVDPDLEGADEIAFCPNDTTGATIDPGVRFRVRYNLDPPNVGFPNYTAHIHFERSCDAECVAGEHRCEPIEGCFDDNDFCFDCGLGTKEECACRTPDNGVFLDCTPCEFILGDAVYLGACQDGFCDIKACDTACVCE
jgi:hypothetical protein